MFLVTVHFRLPHGACLWSHKARDHKPVRATRPWREDVQMHAASADRLGKRASLFTWGFISLSVGQTRCFLKIPINYSHFYVLQAGTPPNQSLLSPGYTDRPPLSNPSPCTILTSTVHVTAFPCSHMVIWHQREGREVC